MTNKKPEGMSDRAWGKYLEMKDREAKRDAEIRAAYEKTPDGKREKLLWEIAEMSKSLEELHRIADAAEKQAAKSEKESIAAKARAKCSFVISVLTLFASLAINADKIIENLQMLLAYLGSLLH